MVVIVEIPKGSRNKYEIDHDTGEIWLDRHLFTATQYPADYGFVPHTLAEDGDPLDASSCSTSPRSPAATSWPGPSACSGCATRPGPDAKVLCVPDQRPPLGGHQRPRATLRSHRLDEIAPLLRGLQGARAEQAHRARPLGRAGRRRGTPSSRRGSGTPSSMPAGKGLDDAATPSWRWCHPAARGRRAADETGRDSDRTVCLRGPPGRRARRRRGASPTGPGPGAGSRGRPARLDGGRSRHGGRRRHRWWPRGAHGRRRLGRRRRRVHTDRDRGRRGAQPRDRLGGRPRGGATGAGEHHLGLRQARPRRRAHLGGRHGDRRRHRGHGGRRQPRGAEGPGPRRLRRHRGPGGARRHRCVRPGRGRARHPRRRNRRRPPGRRADRRRGARRQDPARQGHHAKGGDGLRRRGRGSSGPSITAPTWSTSRSRRRSRAAPSPTRCSTP